MRKTLHPTELPDMSGQQTGHSDWMTIDQKMIDAFAETTGDRQFIHVDPEKAKSGPFGTTIAHGFLTLSLIAGLAEKSLPVFEGQTYGINYGFDRVRFLAPVPVESRVRARFRLWRQA